MTTDLPNEPNETSPRWPGLAAPIVLPLYGVATGWLLWRGGLVAPWPALERVQWTFVLAASATAMSLVGTWYLRAPRDWVAILWAVPAGLLLMGIAPTPDRADSWTVPKRLGLLADPSQGNLPIAQILELRTKRPDDLARVKDEFAAHRAHLIEHCFEHHIRWAGRPIAGKLEVKGLVSRKGTAWSEPSIPYEWDAPMLRCVMDSLRQASPGTRRGGDVEVVLPILYSNQ